MKFLKKGLNIIYFCTADRVPSGGAKTIYNHSDLINNLKLPNITSEILHIKKKKISKWNTSLKKILKIKQNNYFGWKASEIKVVKNFKSKWFKNKIKIKENFIFDKKKDFIIFPEIFAHFSKKLCVENKIPYAIFVQNGYSLNSTSDYKTLNESYNKAKFILSYSKDISNCIKTAFPNCANKILKTNISIDIRKFNLKTNKTNTITFMPRKLPEHSEHLIFFLRKHLPKPWKIKALHNLKENEVYNYLCKSKIFLSFSNMEGLGIPPIEAAIAGNKVIGYTGEGGKGYWHKPIFSEISNGDFSKFHSEIINFIKKGKLNNKEFRIGRKKIIKNFSPELEEKKIKLMLKKINSFY